MNVPVGLKDIDGDHYCVLKGPPTAGMLDQGGFLAPMHGLGGKLVDLTEEHVYDAQTGLYTAAISKAYKAAADYKRALDGAGDCVASSVRRISHEVDELERLVEAESKVVFAKAVASHGFLPADQHRVQGGHFDDDAGVKEAQQRLRDDDAVPSGQLHSTLV